MVGAVVFVSVFIVYGWLYPGYSWTSMFVNELSLGPHGWVQALNFMVTGALVLVEVIGVSLIASGLFATDPSAMFG